MTIIICRYIYSLRNLDSEHFTGSKYCWYAVVDIVCHTLRAVACTLEAIDVIVVELGSTQQKAILTNSSPVRRDRDWLPYTNDNGKLSQYNYTMYKWLAWQCIYNYVQISAYQSHRNTTLPECITCRVGGPYVVIDTHSLIAVGDIYAIYIYY